jgi:hypothetical protein
MASDVVPHPLRSALAPVWARHHGLVVRFLAWTLEAGRPVGSDVAALVIAASEHTGDGQPLGVWTRPRVTSMLSTGFNNWCAIAGCPRPDDEPEALWAYLHFLAGTDALHPDSDPFDALLEPLRCYGGLDGDGLRPAMPQPPNFPCQCFLDVVAPSRAGLSRTITMHEVVIELWRPSQADPVLAAWYQPLARYSRSVRRVSDCWRAHLEDFDFVGRTLATPRTPPVWMYRHRHTRGDIYVDDEGAPYRLHADARRRSGCRFTPTSVLSAGWVAGLAEFDSAPPRALEDAWLDDCPVSIS